MAKVASEAGAKPPSDRHQSTLRLLARESLLSLLGSITAGALNLLLPIVVTRQLTHDDAGIFFEATALFMVVLNVGTLGADTGVLRSLPQALARGEKNLVGVYVRTALGLPVAFAAAGGLLLAWTAPMLGPLLVHDSGTLDDAMTNCLYIVAAMLPIAVAYSVGVATTRGLGSIRVLVLVDKVGKGIVQLALVLAMAVGVGTAAGAVAGWVLAYGAALLAVAYWLVHYRRRGRDRRRTGPAVSRTERRELTRSFWSFAGPRAVSRVCNVAMQRADVLLVGAILGATDAAVYAAATRFLVLGTVFVQAIQQVMAPKISESVALDDLDRARTIYETTTTWLSLISWPVYLLAANFAYFLLGVFGPSYVSGETTAVILCLTMLVATSCGPVDTVLLMAGRSMLSLINAGVSLCVMVCADLLLIPSLGIAGAAIGWSLGILLNNLLALAQVYSTLHMHPFGAPLLVAVTSGLVCFGVVPALLHHLIADDRAALLAAVAVGSTLHATAIRMFRLTLRLDGFSIQQKKPQI